MCALRLQGSPKCIICDRVGEQVYEDIPDYRFDVQEKFNLRLCHFCGLLWVDPKPAIGDLYKCYINEYLCQDIKPSNSILADGHLARVKDFYRRNIFCGYYGYHHLHKKHLLCKLGKLLGRIPILSSKAIFHLGALFPFCKGRNGFIIDIGCGSKAEYLGIMRNLGWNVLGIEPDFKAADIVRKRGIPVFQGVLEEAKLPGSAVDQVIMKHVIEHLPNPLATIEECFRILKEGGKLAIRTPNAIGLGHKVFKRHYGHLDIPRHLFLFSPKSIVRLLKKSSFKKFYIKTLSHNAKYAYDRSRLVFEKGKIDITKITPQKGRYWFALKESILCYLGKDYGEEIDLVAIK